MIENTTGFGLIAVEKKAGRVVFLDPATLGCTAAITDLPPKPHELLIPPLSGKAYVPIFGDGIHGDNPHPQSTIAVIDLAAQSLRTLIDIAPYKAPHTVRQGSNGLIYCCCEASAAVVVIDPASDEMVGAIDIGSTKVHRLATVPGRDRLVTEAEEDGLLSLVRIEGSAGQVIKELSLEGGTNGIAAAPTRPWIVATAGDRPELHVVDRDDLGHVRTLPLPGHTQKGQIARYRPDGAILAVIGNFDPVASLYDADLNHLFTAEVQDKPLDGAFSPDGRLFLVANEDSDTTSVIDLTTGRTRAHVPVDSGFEVLAYYPLAS
ncbi:WD40 repeat domain-containing protein [Acidimangrovimonas sediminis]|uniref:WD40 repeat domain-containing protein n=1 Tax=Acidimangrovimonas sediminis TaxID=2056283 RepID=UPI000C808B11|nr:WD40 repeat domain-containing protein [Acidimangrovimonas sediminis]